MNVVRLHVAEDQESKERRALAASLVHDIGHGPFSHAFEKVGERLGLKFADHEVMSDELIRNSEVSDEFSKLGSGFANDVADIIKKDGVKTIQHAVVSSQFDADRLDYIRRDRMMTGTQHAAIDFRWLIANLEVGSVATGVDTTQVGTIETFVLGPKAIHAAEAYVLGLFQLYPTVYYHKATRSAEKIFTELIVQVVTLFREGNLSATGLDERHPLIRFAKDPGNIDIALTLDDTVVWGALTQMTEATDRLVSNFAARLRDRKLYKCIDIRARVAHKLDPKCENTDELIKEIDTCCTNIQQKLEDLITEKYANFPRILLDKEERSPYKPIGESKGPLDQINIRTDGGVLVDLKERSSVVRALKTFKLFRAYAEQTDAEVRAALENIIEGEIGCRVA